MQTHRPRNTSIYARECLEALSRAGLGVHLSLGGAFGLAHYFEYRTTQDVDAWWQDAATPAERRQVVECIEGALRSYGSVRARSWADVVSIELTVENRKVFSFQIAGRSAQLDTPVNSAWEGIPLDSLDDLIASKMTALVERGAPRDFRDIYTLCTSSILTMARCWELWAMRQKKAGEDADRQRAVLAIRTHLARIEQARPLERIAEMSERHTAQTVRLWYAQEFLHDVD